MSQTVTCVTCHGAFDIHDTVEMPNGPCCDGCYKWLESMMEEMMENGSA